MFKKALSLLTSGLGTKSGVLSLISEKTGKISFKRSAAIMIITSIAIPDYLANGLSSNLIFLCLGAMLIVALPQIIEAIFKNKNKDV